MFIIIIKRMDSANTGRRVVCPTCTRPFVLGWGYTNHLRSCTVAREQDGDDPGDDGDVRNDGDDDVNDGDGHADRQNGEVYTIVAHQTKLEEEGTFDNDHVLKYASWGKVGLQPKEVYLLFIVMYICFSL
jgi:hypothetical protein